MSRQEMNVLPVRVTARDCCRCPRIGSAGQCYGRHGAEAVREANQFDRRAQRRRRMHIRHAAGRSIFRCGSCPPSVLWRHGTRACCARLRYHAHRQRIHSIACRSHARLQLHIWLLATTVLISFVSIRAALCWCMRTVQVDRPCEANATSSHGMGVVRNTGSRTYNKRLLQRP